MQMRNGPCPPHSWMLLPDLVCARTMPAVFPSGQPRLEGGPLQLPTLPPIFPSLPTDSPCGKICESRGRRPYPRPYEYCHGPSPVVLTPPNADRQPLPSPGLKMAEALPGSGIGRGGGRLALARWHPCFTPSLERCQTLRAVSLIL